MNKTLRKELYVMKYGQSWKFRMMKYPVLLALGAFLYYIYGWQGVFLGLEIGMIGAIGLHLVFRWKTNAWTKSWGPYRKMKLPKHE